jgi:hypothetical protein
MIHRGLTAARQHELAEEALDINMGLARKYDISQAIHHEQRALI